MRTDDCFRIASSTEPIAAAGGKVRAAFGKAAADAFAK
jgi:hypothetical protein